MGEGLYDAALQSHKAYVIKLVALTRKPRAHLLAVAC